MAWWRRKDAPAPRQGSELQDARMELLCGRRSWNGRGGGPTGAGRAGGLGRSGNEVHGTKGCRRVEARLAWSHTGGYWQPFSMMMILMMFMMNHGDDHDDNNGDNNGAHPAATMPAAAAS